MSLNRYEWLTRKITYHEHKTIRTNFLDNKFVRMRWFGTKFENNVRKYYRHTEFVVIDKNLNNFYAFYNCSFKLYMKDKPSNYGILFRVLADMTDPCGS